MMKLDILAIVAHPDDAELSCSGTLIKAVKAGHRVGIADLTRGELGTRGSAEKRMKEAARATELMGIHVRENLGLSDGFFEVDREHLLAVIRVIRKYRPKILITNAVKDRHPDHGRASALVSRAAFLSGLRKIESSEDGTPLEAWRPVAVYHVIQDRYIEPDFVVDISDVIEKKFQAIRAFDSQFYVPGEEDKEPRTPISGKEFMDFLRARMRETGRVAGVEYAEGFTVERPPATDDILSFF